MTQFNLGINDVSAQTRQNEDVFTSEEKLWIREHPVLKSINAMAWPPFEFAEDGKEKGYSVDFLNLVAQKAGFKVKYVNGYTFGELLKKLEKREIDIATSIIQTSDRDVYLDFTEPYFALPMVFFGAKGNLPIVNMTSLADQKIGAAFGDVPSKVYQEQYPELDLTIYENSLEAFRGLEKGEIEVLPSILPVGNYFINNYNMENIEVIGERFYPDTGNEGNIRLAARSDWPILTTILSKSMALVTDDERQFLSEKWQINYETKTAFSIGLTSEELAWLSIHPVIKVGANNDVRPIEYLDENGVIKGIAGDYLDEISKLLNIKFEWVGNQSWAEAIMLAKKGEVDLLSAVVRTVDREEYLDFTDNYLTIANMIFARTGSGIYENLDSLAGLSISAEAGDVNVENLKLNHPDITVIEVKSALEAIKLTSIGAADAYVGGLPTTSFYMAEEAITNITAVGETPYISKLGMGVPKGNEILVSILNKAIRSIPPLRKSEIVSNWYSLKIENKPNYTLIINLSIMGSLLLAFILYWNNRLRKEVQYRKKAEEKLVIAQQKTEEESAAKSSFLANMSHEIRTPLNAIVGFSDAMIQGIGGEVIIKKHKEYLKDIKSSGEHLATVIKDILDLSKIEAGKWKLDKSTFNFNDSIIESIKMLEVNISDKQANIHFNNDKNITFTGDQHAVKRIIINLLSNSIKFIGNDGNISINVEVLIKEKLILTIEDDGI